jgi:hypothetical protein
LLFRLPPLLRWIDEPAAVLPEMALASAPTPSGESLVAATGIQYWGSALPLEVIRFAGANRLLIEFVYDGTRRSVEPYSLRQSSAGNLLLYGWEQGSTHIKAFTIARMREVQSTNIAFQPRYRVEFTSAGPLSAPRTATLMPQVTRSGYRLQQRRRRQPIVFGLLTFSRAPTIKNSSDIRRTTLHFETIRCRIGCGIAPGEGVTL